MGRYYNGDINGKFWFAVQSSAAPERFGAMVYEPQEVTYEFNSDSLDQVKKEIENIEKSLGNKKQIFDKFFNERDFYNSDDLKEVLVFENEPLDDFDKHLSDYADLGLGIKIRDCIEETGQCNFTAEY
jgi:hypothetical protein